MCSNFRSNYKNINLKNINCLFLILFCIFFKLTNCQKPDLIKKPVTIFIHGTLLPVFYILNFYKTYNNKTNSEDWYTKCLKKLRVNPILQEDSLILSEGLIKISPDILNQYNQQILPTNLCKIAAYHAIGAYNNISKFVQQNNIDTDYYTFGFLGLLSDKHRKETALILYKNLNLLKERYNQENYDPEFTLIGYSHGGNIILYLGFVEQIEKKQLTITNTLLFGTPIYQETAIYSKENIFQKIINIYSQGDNIQNHDTFQRLVLKVIEALVK